MIKTIGYQRLENVHQLAAILKKNDVKILVDVRSRPYSRKAAFNKNRMGPALERFGLEYCWKGSFLGGFGKISEHAIRYLAEFQKDRAICLMCMEADPDKCHRKTEISRRLKKYGLNINHILT